ncbi:hypothetical protein [Hymenobacter nivis]|uniref:hypothetical protein n=1 Tax=Hymenobacter nivis TaxID=1850093 RepID=UPI0013A569FB|nr:hypothetical protein [Hymenobacter nivis]
MRRGGGPILWYVINSKVQFDGIITQHLPLADAAHGYDIFRNKKENCAKVVLKP